MSESYFIAYSRTEDTRKKSSSGGLFQEIISYLFQNNDIDGVYTLKFNEEKKCYEGYLFESNEAYKQVRIGSIYNQVDFFANITSLQKKRRVAVIASACQKKYIENIYPELLPHMLFIGFICGWSFENAAVQKFMRHMSVPPDAYVTGFRGESLKGNVTFEQADGKKISFPRRSEPSNKKLFLAERTSFNKYYNEERCLYCPDHINKSVGISIGDAWLRRLQNETSGTNMVIVRDTFFLHILNELANKKIIYLEQVGIDDAHESQSTAIYYSTLEKKFAWFANTHNLIKQQVLPWIESPLTDTGALTAVTPISLSIKDRYYLKKFYFLRTRRNSRLGQALIFMEYYYRYYIITLIKKPLKYIIAKLQR